MKILVIGSGGREHALCHTFLRQGHQVVALPCNAATSKLSPQKAVSPENTSKLVKFAQENDIALTVVGPENYLANGIKDIFSKKGLKLFGPLQEATKLESSKSWAKEFMHKYQIPSARFFTCRTSQKAKQIIRDHFAEWGGVAIKPSGLTAGKGVMCCKTLQDAEEAIRIHFDEKRYGDASDKVVIEELLQGPECSLLAFCDGKTMIPMIPSQDHKRLWENDAGPNTGGVGAYAPVPLIGEQILQEIYDQIMEPTNQGLKEEGILYQGVVYFGIMLTAQGPKVLEYNCRFGDPEAQVVLPLLQSDLAEIMLACCDGTLAQKKVTWKPQSACVVVMCSGGYPHSYQTGYQIYGLEDFQNDDNVIVFHAGTKINDHKKVVTNGGRVLGVTGIGDSLNEAVGHAYRCVSKLSFTDAHYRRDIANQSLREFAT
ncbi:MAG: Phosphoribosylamine--glycine ligase [Chlamydiae bacterium]|nr:Phosphoribosylamine--glycine ligase [Chlamydiota bacterium]